MERYLFPGLFSSKHSSAERWEVSISPLSALPVPRKQKGQGEFPHVFPTCFMHFIAHLPCRSKSTGAGPTISHRISHSSLATAPKAFVSSLEILPNVILGYDLIEEAHRDSMTITVPAVIGCPTPEGASMGLTSYADKQNLATNTFSSHHNKTMPKITQSIPHWGWGWDEGC